MLLLRRKCDESVMIGKEITITVLEIERGQVLLGFDAPPSIRILREEVVEHVARGGRERDQGCEEGT